MPNEKHNIKPDLSKAELSSAHLSEANLRGADLIRASLIRASLIRADLSGAHFIRADLYLAHLSGADLSGADLSGADLRGADLNKASIGFTVFANNDLSVVKGLESVRHVGPSTIGVDTLYKSGGNIPVDFLRGCGVPDDFIAFIPSHFGLRQAIQFYSCFISYSTKDEDFARRLYSRMRDEKLRVWFAPEDIQGGEKMHEQIERAIQLHDRPLLVLSESSMQS